MDVVAERRYDNNIQNQHMLRNLTRTLTIVVSLMAIHIILEHDKRQRMAFGLLTSYSSRIYLILRN